MDYGKGFRFPSMLHSLLYEIHGAKNMFLIQGKFYRGNRFACLEFDRKLKSFLCHLHYFCNSSHTVSVISLPALSFSTLAG